MIIVSCQSVTPIPEKPQGKAVVDDLNISGQFKQAISLSEAGQFDQASLKFRRLLGYDRLLSKKDQARVLIELFDVYTAQGKTAQALATLIDLKKRKGQLPPAFYRLVLPAKFASIYSRLGDKERARIYFSEVQTAMKDAKLVGHEFSDTSKSPEDFLSGLGSLQKDLPETLFRIGSLPPSTITAEDIQDGLPALQASQPFLVLSAGTGKNQWAEKAIINLISCYEKMFDLINHIQVPGQTDPDIELVEANQIRTSLALIVGQRYDDLLMLLKKSSIDSDSLEKVKALGHKLDLLFQISDPRDKNIRSKENKS